MMISTAMVNRTTSSNNASTRQTAVWYLNNNTYIGGGYAPSLPTGWTVVDVADFNRDAHPDYALFNPTKGQTAIWYLNNRLYLVGAYGPTLPNGWRLAAVSDFNRDGKPDYVLYNASTRQTAIWYLNNNVYVSGAYGPTIASGYVLSGVADFNGDGKPGLFTLQRNHPSNRHLVFEQQCVRQGLPTAGLLPAATCYRGLRLTLTVTGTRIMCFTMPPLARQRSGI